CARDGDWGDYRNWFDVW
nr:immunoglobulin heavy chain junction region [Macaca mulatta]